MRARAEVTISYTINNEHVKPVVYSGWMTSMALRSMAKDEERQPGTITELCQAAFEEALLKLITHVSSEFYEPKSIDDEDEVVDVDSRVT